MPRHPRQIRTEVSESFSCDFHFALAYSSFQLDPLGTAAGKPAARGSGKKAKATVEGL